MPVLQGFDPIPLDDAVVMLSSESSLEGELTEIASMLDCEPPVLKWAASLAKTLGWGPLRTRIVSWSSLAKAPWHEDVARATETLSAEDAALLGTLAACDAPFAWDVLEAVLPDVSIEGICRLEEARLLRRTTRAGVVTFLVPYAVRAFLRAKGSLGDAPERWLDAWVARAEALRSSSYGPSSRATLTELGAAVPLAARALFTEASAAKGLLLWTAASDAIFFGDATSFDAPAFLRAVEVADAGQTLEPRVRARLVAGRAMLERGDPAGAAKLTKEARELANDELRADALRGNAWAALALTNLDEARAAFTEARTLAEGEPRGQADATAGLGILSLMTGDPSAARALLAEALAIHVVMRDAPRESAVRGMMELLPSEGGADVSHLASQVDELRAKGQRWREALALARLALDARARGDAETERARLLEARAAASLSSMPASKLVRSLVEHDALEPAKSFFVASEGRALTLPTGETHDLARHGPVRRILWALALLRRDRPGAAMSTLDMIEAGWPGEKMQHEAATLRVYTTIRRLRGLGLGDVLVTRDEGYLLDPDVTVRVE
ncbi:MAG: hypothetical protein U0270_21225 [Labilithrix sp.]